MEDYWSVQLVASDLSAFDRTKSSGNFKIQSFFRHQRNLVLIVRETLSRLAKYEQIHSPERTWQGELRYVYIYTYINNIYIYIYNICSNVVPDDFHLIPCGPPIQSMISWCWITRSWCVTLETNIARLEISHGNYHPYQLLPSDPFWGVLSQNFLRG